LARKLVGGIIVAGLVAIGWWCILPQRYEIDGLSMAPALLPGDVVATPWLPWADRRARLRRFDRWLLTAPDGSSVIKRLVGLPGETVGFVDGDLAIDGALVLTPPRVLAQVASRVTECEQHDGPWQRWFHADTVWDDAVFASDESRRLAACRDIGIAAVVDHDTTGKLEAAIRVGGRAIRWSFTTAGRHAIVAGYLDRRLVAAAWPVPHAAVGWARSALPPHPPQSWSIVEEWTEESAGPPVLGVSLMRDGVSLTAAECDRRLVSCAVWRDILHLPPATGTTAWRVKPDAVFVLGDFPAGSRDARHWGPLPTAALRARIVDR
jgi:type IV secretory pathway protease TraF